MKNIGRFWKYLPIGSAIHYIKYEEIPQKPSREYTIKTLFHTLYACAAILTATVIGLNQRGYIEFNQLPKCQNERRLEAPQNIDTRDSSLRGLEKIIKHD